MSNTTPPPSDDSVDPGPAMGFTQLIIASLELPDLPEERPKTAHQIRQRYAAIRWLRKHEDALDAAKDADDECFRDLMLEWLRILRLPVPETPGWVYPLGSLVYAIVTLLALPYILNRIFPSVAKFTIFLILLLTSFLGLRVYFTFRGRILACYGIPKRHRRPSVNLFGELFTALFAVGTPAFRAAPLAEAWSGLTGGERVQPSRERTTIMVLVILAATVLDIGLPTATFILGQRLVELARGTSILGCIIVWVLAIVNTLTHIASLRLTQMGLRECQLLADRLGYRWAHATPTRLYRSAPRVISSPQSHSRPRATGRRRTGG